MTPQVSPPTVTVVEGGRKGEAPEPDPESRPNLQLAEEPTAEQDPVSAAPLHTHVRVLRPNAAATALQTEGRIQLAPETTQTVYRGDTVRTYRIECLRGSFQIRANGALVDTLLRGQSTDVEASLIQVSAPKSATGRYTNL